MTTDASDNRVGAAHALLKPLPPPRRQIRLFGPCVVRDGESTSVAADEVGASP
jgi:hypothetical protein